MPLARAQRTALAHVMRWARSHGWVHDSLPNAWRSAAGDEYVRYDSTDHHLTVSLMASEPMRWRAAVIPVDSPEIAIDVLAALRHIPAGFSTLSRQLPPALDTANCVRWYRREEHLGHRWQRGDRMVQCAGWREATQLLGEAFDNPACFAAAGLAFANWVDGRVSADLAAEVLSKCSLDGLIVSVAYHDEVVNGTLLGSGIPR